MAEYQDTLEDQDTPEHQDTLEHQVITAECRTEIEGHKCKQVTDWGLISQTMPSS